MRTVEFNRVKVVKMREKIKVSKVVLLISQVSEYSGNHYYVLHIMGNVRTLCRWQKRNKEVKKRMRKQI